MLQLCNEVDHGRLDKFVLAVSYRAAVAERC